MSDVRRLTFLYGDQAEISVRCAVAPRGGASALTRRLARSECPGMSKQIVLRSCRKGQVCFCCNSRRALRHRKPILLSHLYDSSFGG